MKSDQQIIAEANEAFKFSGSAQVMFDEERREGLGKAILSLSLEAVEAGPIARLAANTAWANFTTRALYIAANPPPNTVKCIGCGVMLPVRLRQDVCDTCAHYEPPDSHETEEREE